MNVDTSSLFKPLHIMALAFLTAVGARVGWEVGAWLWHLIG